MQQYHSNPTRKYPLLGLNFLVEYRWTDSNKLCGYLCLLCKKAVREPLVIAHVIGFEHVFSYLDIAHPSSLGSRSLYKHYDACYGALIFDLATQAEKIGGSGKVQEIKLDQAAFEEVESSQFSNALKKLQAVSDEKILSFIPLLVSPGGTLVPKTYKPALSSESKCEGSSSNPESLAHPVVVKPLAQPVDPEETGKSLQKLWDYLKNKERQEPVIGLDAVIECTSDKLPPYYLCKTCSEKMSQDFIVDHITNPCHRFQYLKSQELLSSVEKNGLNAGAIKERAVTVEKERGFGEAQVLELDATQYQEIVSSSTEVALKMLQTIQEQQSDLQHLVTSEPKLDIQRIVNMQEPMDETSLNVKCTGKNLCE